MNHKIHDMSVMDVLQDSQGYLWIGTSDGLFRYDGHEIKEYKYNRKESSSLPGNFIVHLFEDSKNQLWVGTISSGLSKFNRDTDTFIDFTELTKHKLSYPDIHLLYEDSKNNIWIATHFGLNLWKPKNNELQKFYRNDRVSQSLYSNRVHSIVEDNLDNIWIGTDSGLCVFSYKTQSFQRYPKLIPQTLVRDLIYKNNKLYISTDIGLYQYHIRETTSKRLLKGRINSSILLDDHYIFSGSLNRLFQVNLKTERTFVYVGEDRQSNNVYKLRAHQILRKIHKDRDNNIWLAFELSGIQYFNFEKKLPISFHPSESKLDLSTSYTISSYKNSAFLLTSFFQGVHKFDLETKQYTKHLNFVNNDTVLHVFKQDSDVYYISRDAFIYKLEETGSSLKFLPLKKLENFNYHFSDLIKVYRENADSYWFATLKGLVHYSDGKKYVYKHDPMDRSSLSNNSVGFILKSSDGNLWIATANGLNLLKRSQKSFTRYLSDRGNSKSLSHHFVSSIYEDYKKRLWVGTIGGGVNYFNRKNQSFYTITRDNGLTSNLIQSVSGDKYKNLWIASEKGLSKIKLPDKEIFDINDLSVINYRSEHYSNKAGIQKNTKTVLNNRYFAYGTNKGILLLDTDETEKPDSLKKIKLLVKGKFPEADLYKTEKGIEPGSYKFHPDDLPINFSIKNFYLTGLKEEIFFYKITPGIPDWKKIKPDGKFQLENILPGKYILELRAASAKNRVYRYSIHLEGSTVLSRILLIIFFISLLTGIYFYIKNKRLKRPENKQLETILHDIKTPLTLLINELSYLNLPKEKRKSLSLKTQEIRDIIIGTMDIIKEKKSNNESISINRILDDTYTLFKEITEKKSIHFSIDLMQQDQVIYTDPKLLKSVLNNLIMNAVNACKSNDSILVKTNFLKNGNELEINVIDSGPGISKENRNKIFEENISLNRGKHNYGLGLKHVHDILENFLNGKIKLESKKNSKTCFQIKIPVNNPNDDEKLKKLGKINAHISIIEDDNKLLYYLEETLLNYFSNISIFISAEDFLDKSVNHEQYDLLIIDIGLPGKSGIHLLDDIRKNAQLHHLPLIIITGDRNNESFEKAYHSGANAILKKPFLIEELIYKCRNQILISNYLKKQYNQKLIFKPKYPESGEISFINSFTAHVEVMLGKDEIDIRDLADKMNVSQSTLYRKVKEYTDLSPQSFIKLLKLITAENMLKNKSMTISEIAYKCGFNHISYFAKSFKEEYGMEPSKYREFLIKDKQV